ncbi:MAG: helix-turn-helix transcriptional regulator [Prevotellaceae bacterium]|jgi:transcriptional regulator with XRE-family HTH domain|nr:helix-turn-helix transcriptional regulator [Prevotellaceae bacterium]
MKNRIIQLMSEKGLSRIEFAEKIGVQRSNISHILEGRNRPSLDFIEKLARAYPALNMNWLLKGEGSMFKKMEQMSLFSTETEANSAPEQLALYSAEDTSTVQKEVKVNPESSVSSQSSDLGQEKSLQTDSEIEKIIIFYGDKTFESYKAR